MTLVYQQAVYGIAFIITRQLTEFTVIERSLIGTGFDYWLGSENEAGELPFQNKVRLIDGNSEENMRQATGSF